MGSHGGLGGWQSHPFALVPSELERARGADRRRQGDARRAPRLARRDRARAQPSPELRGKGGGGDGPDSDAGAGEGDSARESGPVGVADAGYRRRRERLRDQYAAIPAGSPVRLAKRTSNLFRARSGAQAPGLDVAAFDGVLSVDPVAGTADVQGMTTYEHLVDATLAHGLMPLVVPQLKTITLGGAVTGLGIESTSFRNGCPHESVLELEVLTGDGEILVARPDNEHSDLYYGFPNSYGTLGYALRMTIELEPVRPYVRAAPRAVRRRA